MKIPGFELYDITESGVVTRLRDGKVIQPYIQKNGIYRYPSVSLLAKDGRYHVNRVARLLAITFLDKPDYPCMVRMVDNDSMHVELSNVRWASYAESTMKAWKAGKYLGRTKPCTCCTPDSMEMVLCALEQFDDVTTVAELGRLLDVPYSTVRYSMRALVQEGKAEYVSGKGFRLTR